MDQVRRLAETAADPDRAFANVTRLLADRKDSSWNVGDRPWLLERLCLVMGAGQAVADSIIQNRELSEILADPDELFAEVRYDDLIVEGEGLLKNSNSFTHQLDRIRYLKQRHLIRIVYHDLAGSWNPETIWKSLSILADAVFELCVRCVWNDISYGEIPIGVIALGKHGGKEINYSSDIDVLFIANDDEKDLSNSIRLCEKLTRALSGHMGRGFLYRIDHKLRPMGKVGPIVQKVSATIGYYHAYAEPWEIMAQIRARHCAGNREVSKIFLEEVKNEVYKGPRTDLFMDGILDAKQRYENEIKNRGEWESNLKLGGGGIRDIEFVVQVFQLLIGNKEERLIGASTCDAIQVLRERGDLLEREGTILSSAYPFYRQVEHRIQLLHNLQSHTLPDSKKEQTALARSLGFSTYAELMSKIRKHQSLVREVILNRVPRLSFNEPHLQGAKLLNYEIGTSEYKLAERMIVSSDEPKTVLAALDDEEFASRFRKIIEYAPKTALDVAFYKPFWDVAFSEEPELQEHEESDIESEIQERIMSPNWEASLAGFLRKSWVVAALRHAYHKDAERTGRFLSKVSASVLLSVMDKIGGQSIDVIGLGRLGSGDLLFGSDWDVMLLAGEGIDQVRAEKIGETWVRTVRKICSSSGHFSLDTRLRPEGRDGLVVRSLTGFRNYAETAMETWERMAFTRARSLRSLPGSIELIKVATYGNVWSEKNELELKRTLHRIREERVNPNESKRDLKLGKGFLLDIEWLVGILKLRHNGNQFESSGIMSGLNELNHQNILSIAEKSCLHDAYLLYSNIRNCQHLLDFESDTILPENPHKLAKIAKVLDYSNENNLLSAIEEKRSEVIAIFNQLTGETF